MFTATVELLLLLLVVLPLECMKVQYLEDPSTQNLACNPHGSNVRLHCTIEEPSSLKIATHLLLLWYWTPFRANPVNDSCQIHPQYQCDQYVGRHKYDFEFKRVNDKSNQSLLLRRVDLIIHNVGIEDQGCYNCRPWLDSSPLPFEESSGLFCLESYSYYDHLPLCHSEKALVGNDTAVNSSLTIKGASTTNYDINPSSTFMKKCTEPSVTDSATNKTRAMSMYYSEEIFQYTTISICIGLCMLSFIQTIVIVYLCQWKYRQCGHNTDRQTTAKRENAMLVSESYINNNSRSRHSSLPIIGHSQNFIGTYSYAKAPQNVNYDYSDSNKTNKDKLSCEEIAESAVAVERDSLSVSIMSPSVHIYQTLDKYLEQLANHPFTFTEVEKEMNKSQPSYDQLFDDPNYTHVEITEEQESTALPSNKLTRHKSTPDNYDKLQPKPSDSEYTYAYSHMLKLRRKLKKLKRKDGHVDPSSRFHVELLRVEAMGAYEIDSGLIPGQLGKEEACISNRSEVPDSDSPPTIPAAKHLNERSLDSSVVSEQHQYQSLDERTLNPSNGYAHLIK